MSDKIGFVEQPGTADLRTGDLAGLRLPAKRFGVHVEPLGGLAEGQEHGDPLRPWRAIGRRHSSWPGLRHGGSRS
ncbi:MAG: hypothetical protein ACYDBH_11365 [Acidobacteriaceae bacterium]